MRNPPNSTEHTLPRLKYHDGSEVEESVIQLYEGNYQDSMLLLQWWMDLVESGDLENAFFPSAHALGPFMGMFNGASRVSLIYSTDTFNRIQLAAWGESVAAGILFFSFWARKSLRFTKHGVQMTLDLYSKAFEHFNLLCGITKQERLLKVHKKLGYQVVGKFPHLWGGVEDGWLMTLTRDDFFRAVGGKG